ncbi:MAG TPA: LemA family protein, partial [Pseudonocardiaceae bacterium]
MTVVLVVVLAVLVVAALGAVLAYNRFVRQRNTIDEAWRQIDVELQRRHDLVPALVEVVGRAAAAE